MLERLRVEDEHAVSHAMDQSVQRLGIGAQVVQQLSQHETVLEEQLRKKIGLGLEERSR